MACKEGAAPTGRSDVADDASTHTDTETHPESSSAPEDFEFCILSSGGLALTGDDAADMCVADEVFSGGKLLPLRLSSANSADAPAALLLLRSDSLDGAATAVSTSSGGFSSRSVSRSASSSSSSSVSRSASSKSASSDHASSSSKSASSDLASSSSKSAPSAGAAVVPPRRSLSSSVFYAHPSPSPRPPRRSARSAAASAPRRSTGSAPPASWGVIRLGVVGAPEVYAPRSAEYRKPAAARFEQQRTADKKLALGLLGAGLVCSCSPDAVAPLGSAEVAAADARRRRKKAEEMKRAAAIAKQSGKSTARRSRILEWLEELSISKEKSVV